MAPPKGNSPEGVYYDAPGPPYLGLGASHVVSSCLQRWWLLLAEGYKSWYLAGTRGSALFDSPWAHVLDAQPNELIYLAKDARRLGLLDMSQSGDVIDVSLSRLLTQDERQ